MDKETKIKEKKKIIIEALKRCLIKDVYSRVTVQEVADEAGFSKGGLLHYFSSKEDMYLDLIKQLSSEIKSDYEEVLRGDLQTAEKVGISVLFDVEKYFLDNKTTVILLNLILYSYEDEKIRAYLQEFLREHLNFYESIAAESMQQHPVRRKNDLDPRSRARIAQIIILAAGLVESIDPSDLDHTQLIRYVLSLLKG